MPETSENSEPHKQEWKVKIKQFETDYAATLAAHPNWSKTQISTHLNISSRTLHRMLAVLRHIDDPRISSSVTLNQAYGKIKTYYQNPTNTSEQITEMVNSIVPTGDPECPK